MHVTRRIEEVNTQKVRAKILRSARGKLFQRNAAGIRGDHRSRAPVLLDFFVEAAFNVETLDDRFNDQIAVFESWQIVFEIPNCYEGSKIRGKECCGFGFLRGFQTGASYSVAI